jgi:hypothetical protein
MIAPLPVIRVAENERDSLITCPTSYGVADKPVDVSHAKHERHAWPRRVQRKQFRAAILILNGETQPQLSLPQTVIAQIVIARSEATRQ